MAARRASRLSSARGAEDLEIASGLADGDLVIPANAGVDGRIKSDGPGKKDVRDIARNASLPSLAGG